MSTLSELLNEFTKILYDLDPMGLKSPKETEYEGEALSILCRFVEHQIDHSNIRVVNDIIIGVWRGWFDEVPTEQTLALISLPLFSAYVKRYPKKNGTNR